MPSGANRAAREAKSLFPYTQTSGIHLQACRDHLDSKRPHDRSRAARSRTCPIRGHDWNWPGTGRKERSPASDIFRPD